MNKPYIVGVTGGSGSGKTTFIDSLKKAFSAEELCFISQDNYYRPRTEQAIDHNGIKNFDLPESIDDKAFAEDLKKIISGQTISRLEYVYNNAEAQPRTLTFKPAPVLIIEGIFIFHFKAIYDLIDLKLFIEVKENLKLIRRIKRDQVERNYPIEDVLYRYQHHVSPTFEKFIYPYRADADLIINNNTDFKAALDVVKGFLTNKIRESKIE